MTTVFRTDAMPSSAKTAYIKWAEKDSNLRCFLVGVLQTLALAFGNPGPFKDLLRKWGRGYISSFLRKLDTISRHTDP